MQQPMNQALKKLALLIFVLICTAINSYSQNNTIKVVQYNLLYYGLESDYCTSSNNNISTKTNYLKKIINLTNPDIFAVNEIGESQNAHDYLLQNVFTLNNKKNYARGKVKGSYLTSQIFYNTKKITLKKENEIYANPRKIHEYVFYYNSAELLSGDTVYFSYFVAHLKAGNNNTDEDKRATATNNLMNYIKTHDISNYILSGDLNLYKSSEQAYQYLTNNSWTAINFIDPAIAGSWHNNSNYSNYHTQSTSKGNSNCGAGGGLDDRFDFILYSRAIENGSDKMQYMSNSFKTIGQDGNHFNQNVSWNGNTTVPTEILTALENNSDHLPISAKFSINQTPASIKDTKTQNIIVSSDKHSIKIFLNNANGKTPTQITLYDLSGRPVLSKTRTNSEININTSNFQHGIYILKIITRSYSITKKIIIQ